MISTDFCDLSIPGAWSGQIHTEAMESDDGSAVLFYGDVGGKKTELFTVLFSYSAEHTGVPVGIISCDEESVLISVKVNDLDPDDFSSDEERNTLATICDEVLNHLIAQLSARPDFSEDIRVMDSGESEPLIVTTPFAVLQYPGTWKDQVWAEYTQTEADGYAVFYGAVGGEDVVLFVVNFDSTLEDASRIGYMQINGSFVEVSIQMTQPENTENWRVEDRSLLAAMQEGVNDLIQNLKQSSGFTTDLIIPPTEATAQDHEEDVIISTSYVDLAVPVQWEEHIHTHTEDLAEGYVVTFIGTVDDHEVVLFTFLFGVETDGSVPVGVLNVDGTAVSISVEMMEIALDDTWSSDEENVVVAMQESINDILEALQENPGFSVQ